MNGQRGIKINTVAILGGGLAAITFATLLVKHGLRNEDTKATMIR